MRAHSDHEAIFTDYEKINYTYTHLNNFQSALFSYLGPATVTTHHSSVIKLPGAAPGPQINHTVR